MSRKERKKAKRKKRIMDAATQIFREKGFQKATTKEIAEAADVAEGTIYNYFESKEHLLIEIINSMSVVRTDTELLEMSYQLDYREFLKAASVRNLKGVNDEFSFFISLLPELLQTPTLRDLTYEKILKPSIEVGEEYVQRRTEMGHIKGVENIPLLVRFSRATTLGLEVLYLLGDPLIKELWNNPEELAEHFIKIFLDQYLADGGEE